MQEGNSEQIEKPITETSQEGLKPQKQVEINSKIIDHGIDENITAEGKFSTNIDFRKSLVDKIARLGKDIHVPGHGTLKDASFLWWVNSDNYIIQLIGKAASANPEYLHEIHKILLERYPTGLIRIFRGSGRARELFLEREFTNVTSNRKVAAKYDKTWPKEGEKVSLDSIVVKVEDVVNIQAATVENVAESELIIPTKILKERIANPISISFSTDLTRPVSAPVSTEASKPAETPSIKLSIAEEATAEVVASKAPILKRIINRLSTIVNPKKS